MLHFFVKYGRMLLRHNRIIYTRWGTILQAKSVPLFPHTLPGRDCVATMRGNIFSVHPRGAPFLLPHYMPCKFREISEG